MVSKDSRLFLEFSSWTQVQGEWRDLSFSSVENYFKARESSVMVYSFLLEGVCGFQVTESYIRIRKEGV